MTRVLCAVALTGIVATGSSMSAHHSYAAYDRTRLVEIEGTIEDFQMISPHSLLTVRDRDGRVYTFEWLATNGMKRWGIESDTLKRGEHVVAGGNPRRDFDESGIVNCRSVRRPSDGWTWPNR